MIKLIFNLFRYKKIEKITAKEVKLHEVLKSNIDAQLKVEEAYDKEAKIYKQLQGQLEVKSVDQRALDSLMHTNLNSQRFYQKQLSLILNQIGTILDELKVLQDEKKKLYLKMK